MSQSTVNDDHEWEATSEFGVRLREAMGGMSDTTLSKRADVPTSTLSRIMKGTAPSLANAVRLSQAVGADLIWLATGRGVPNGAAGGYIDVPIYDVRLAAGVAQFAEAAEQIGAMPFDRGMLRDLGRTSADGLGVFIGEGDSMFPTITDGARVLADLKDTRIRDGVFAFRTGDELRIKRLRRLMDGIEIRSDNEKLYPPELLTGDAADELVVIGRILWTGTAV